jgi:hypothetical protein
MRLRDAFLIGLAAVSGLGAAAAIAERARDGQASAPPVKARPAPREASADARRSLARAFVASLSDAERAKCVRPLDDAERTKWYFARGDRAGLFLRDMDDDTRRAALALVDSILSGAGREQWRLIRAVEAINAANERASGVATPTYGDTLYAMHFFGSPEDIAWAFEIEGHHFVVHAAQVGDECTVTPVFTGSFPAEIGEGTEKGKRPLGGPVEIAFELARSLDAAQREKARIMDRPPADVLWAVGADAKAPEPRGVARSEMNDAQRALVDRLLATHAALYDDSVAERQLREWRTRHGGALAFAFVGETDLRKPHYYRLASPSFTIEYDSTNADASHVHCVWSDPASNFGGDALRAHLRAEHAAPAK